MSVNVCCVLFTAQVLHAVLNGLNGKHNCFKDSTEEFCGNRIVEANEECDCGFQRDCDEHRDTCCYPREDQENACHRRDNTMCRSVGVVLRVERRSSDQEVAG